MQTMQKTVLVMTLSTFVILACFVLPLWLNAEVVTQFDLCKQFFYKGSEPIGFDQNYVRICQKYNNVYYYATLYSINHRIPAFSAYKFDFTCNQNNAGRQSNWFIEPQLSGYQDVNMDLPGNNRNVLKSVQAIDDFYKDTNYDRGHLNPNNYQCDRGRLATFTLTNAVPMDPCFNQQHWKQYEDEIKSIVRPHYGKGLPYFVTGVVPSSEKIPVPILDTVEHDRDFRMVTVPSHIWTALCFDANKQEESFSLGYIGENKPEALINILSIEELERQLRELYGISNFRIFLDDCGSSNEKSKQYLKHILKKIYIPQHRKAGALDNNLSTKASNTLNTLILNKRRRSSSQQSRDKMEILDMVVEMEYSKMSEWFESNEIFKSYTNTACVFTSKTDLLSHHHIKVRSAKNINDHTCTLVSEKSSPQSVITADGTRCLEGKTCSGSCETTKGSKLCCTTPCLYNPDSKSYTCTSGHQSIECSPQYSTITKSGKPCRKDHECGLYGETEYWCYTEGTNREFCNPPFGTVSVESLDPLKSYIDTEKGVALIADNGMFWCSNSAINYKIEAAKIYNDDWCKFKVSRAHNSNILLRDKRGMYLSRIRWRGIDYIHASKHVPDVFCEFQVFIEDEKVLFKADNGKMLSRVYRNGEQNIEAAKDAPDVFCKFTVSSGGTTEKEELRK